MFVLEVGTNHLGKVSMAERYVDYFNNSDFNEITFMCQSKLWYKKKKQILPKEFYIKTLKLLKKKNKKIGLSVCDTKTYNDLKKIPFNFYKLLGVAINNYELIKLLKKKKKFIYISTYKANSSQIKNCLKKLKNYKKKMLLFSPVAKKKDELNFNELNYMKKKYKVNVGYLNHFPDYKIMYNLTSFKIKKIFFYIKLNNKKNIYNDDDHAIPIKQVEKFTNKFLMNKNEKIF